MRRESKGKRDPSRKSGEGKTIRDRTRTAPSISRTGSRTNALLCILNKKRKSIFKKRKKKERRRRRKRERVKQAKKPKPSLFPGKKQHGKLFEKKEKRVASHASAENTSFPPSQEVLGDCLDHRPNTPSPPWGQNRKRSLPNFFKLPFPSLSLSRSCSRFWLGK